MAPSRQQQSYLGRTARRARTPRVLMPVQLGPNAPSHSRTFQHVFTFPHPVRTEPHQIQNFIDGQFVGSVAGRYLDNIEPATGKPSSQVADSDGRDVDLAVAAAEKAL